jgi:hypothetical protein
MVKINEAKSGESLLHACGPARHVKDTETGPLPA